jgi:hypothetical protein
MQNEKAVSAGDALAPQPQSEAFAGLSAEHHGFAGLPEHRQPSNLPLRAEAPVLAPSPDVDALKTAAAQLKLGTHRATGNQQWEAQCKAVSAWLWKLSEAAPVLAVPPPHHATNEQFRASADRVMEKHRPSLEKLAANDSAAVPRPAAGPRELLERAATILHRLTDGDCEPNAEYCWWCQADVNGKSGQFVKEPHEPDCRYIEAQAVLAALRDIARSPQPEKATPEDR